MQTSESHLAAYEQKPPQTGASVSSGNRSEDNDDDPDQQPKRARRTFLTQNACQRCRLKKSKCDGKRPICGSCEKNGVECIYDAAREGLTRMQNLQQQLEIRSADYAKLQSVFAALEQGTDQEATTLLARLRMGASTEDLLHFTQSVHPSSRMTDGGPSQSTSATTNNISSPQPISYNYQPQQNTGYTQGWPQDDSQDVRFQGMALQSQGFPQHAGSHEYEYQQPAAEPMGQPQQDISAMEVIMWHEQAGMKPSSRAPTHEVQQRAEPRPFPLNQSLGNALPHGPSRRPHQDVPRKRRP